MSNANVEYIRKHSKTAQTKLIKVCPNSIEPSNLFYTQEQKQKVRSKYGLPTDKTIFVYGGNLGRPQSVDFIIECLRRNEENENSFILIVGSGTEQNKLEEYFIGHKPKNSKLIPFLPKIDNDLLIRCCDVGLIFLDHRFSIPNYPSRILSYMDAALPILAATDTNTDIKQLIIEEKLGYWCESNDVNSFNNSLQLLCEPDVLLRMGANSKKTLFTKFTSNLTYETMSKHFFVYCLDYGSNMSKNQMKDRCKSAEFISAGYLDGYQLVFDGYSKNRNGMVADIRKSADSKVQYVLWKVSETDMTCLDDHEGYPKHYEKACIPVPINNQIVDAIVYTMTDSKKNSRQSSSGVSPEYIELIRNGLAENGLGETYLDDALLNLTNKSQE